MHVVDFVHLSGDLGNMNDVLKCVVGLPAQNERDWTMLILRICDIYWRLQHEMPGPPRQCVVALTFTSTN